MNCWLQADVVACLQGCQWEKASEMFQQMQVGAFLPGNSQESLSAGKQNVFCLGSMQL